MTERIVLCNRVVRPIVSTEPRWEDPASAAGSSRDREKVHFDNSKHERLDQSQVLEIRIFFSALVRETANGRQVLVKALVVGM